MKSKNKKIGIVLVFVLIVSVFAACSTSSYDGTASSSASYYTGSVEEGYYKTEEAVADYDTGVGGEISTIPESEEMVENANSDRKIIKEASLNLETKTFDDTIALVRKAVAEAGGYISYSNQSGNIENANRYFNYSLKIPSEKYDSFMNSIKDGGNVVYIEEGSRDVTFEYVDLEARLESLKAQEERLFALMEKADTLESIIAIQDQLSDVQYRIESYTSQLKLLENSVSYSTIDIYISEVATYTPVQSSFADRIGRAFEGMWINIVDGSQNFVISVIYSIPLVIFLAVVAVIVVLIVKRTRKKKKVYIDNSEDSN